MKILYLCHRTPFPPNKGDKIRSFHEIKYFSRRHEIHLLAFCDQTSDLAHVGELEKFCRTVRLVPLRPWPQRARAAAYMLRRKPWTLGYFESPAMWKALADVLRAHAFDLAFGYSSSVGPYLQSIHGIPKILDFVDSDASKWRQYAESRPFPAGRLYGYEARVLAQYEDAIAREFDCSIFVSSREARHLAAHEKNGKICFIQNGIDLDFFTPLSRDPASHTVVFMGAMNYFPNVDAVTFFARDIFPRVRRKIGDAQFLIVGSQPAPAVQRLGALTGVTVTGTVPDVRPYLAQARVAVIPIRVSQGIQNKILEALATGLPVVTTSIAAEGLAPTGDLPVKRALEPGEFADRVVEFLAKPPLSAREVECCRRQLRRDYDWETNLSAFDAIFQKVTAGHSVVSCQS